MFFVDSKSQRAFKLHYWFKSYGNFVGICQAESKDYSALRHLGNRNLTWESPQISNSRPQTPNEVIGTLSAQCATQDVLKKKVLQSTKSGRN